MGVSINSLYTQVREPLLGTDKKFVCISVILNAINSSFGCKELFFLCFILKTSRQVQRLKPLIRFNCSLRLIATIRPLQLPPTPLTGCLAPRCEVHLSCTWTCYPIENVVQCHLAVNGEDSSRSDKIHWPVSVWHCTGSFWISTPLYHDRRI